MLPPERIGTSSPALRTRSRLSIAFASAAREAWSRASNVSELGDVGFQAAIYHAGLVSLLYDVNSTYSSWAEPGAKDRV